MSSKAVANKIKLANQTVTVYASNRVGQALEAVVNELTLFQGVKLSQLLEAVYAQGKKDGARSAFELLETKLGEAERAIPHRNPGKPRKRRI